MDFITELPWSEGCNQLWVIENRFTKMGHFIPLKEKTALDLARIFAKEFGKITGYLRTSCQIEIRVSHQKSGGNS